MIAKCSSNGSRALGNLHGEQGQTDGDDVRYHVGGVRQQSQAAGNDSPDYFNPNLVGNKARTNIRLRFPAAR